MQNSNPHPLRTIGLLGGFTWHSTAKYYTEINQTVAAQAGAFRSAPMVLHSIDYGTLRQARRAGTWKAFARSLVRAARGLKSAGAEGLCICSNTMHRFAPNMEAEVGLPVLHVADSIACQARTDGHERLGLLGTAFTTQQPFYRMRLQALGFEVLTSDDATTEALDHILMAELAKGQILPSSRDRFLEAIVALHEQGATAMILGCTEIGMLIDASHTSVPLLDSTTLHAAYAARWSMGQATRGPATDG